MGHSRQRGWPPHGLPGHWSECEWVRGKKCSSRSEPGQPGKGLLQTAVEFGLCPMVTEDYRNILRQGET